MPAPLILLVDDAADVGLIVRRLGERAGQRVEVRPTAELAWEYLQHQQPDLAILDIHLPGASGIDLCRQIRGDSRLRDLAVALLAPLDLADALAAALDAGADHVMSKELLTRPADWLGRIEEILADRAPTARPLPCTLDPCRQFYHRLAARLDGRVLAALGRRISPHAPPADASKIGEWLSQLDGTDRRQALIQQLERVLGHQWCADLWTALGLESRLE